MALAAAQKTIFVMVDNAGKLGTTSVHVPMASGSDPVTAAATVATALNGVSNCQIIKGIGQTPANTVEGTPTTGQGYDIRDKLAVEYIGSQNDRHMMMIGSPLEDAFLAANMEIGDLAGTLADLVTAIQGNVKDKLGVAVRVIRAYRQRSRKLKTTLKFT